MPRFIIHTDGLFFEWTTVADGPTTCAMTRPEFEAYWRNLHGSQGVLELAARLDRAEKNGTSLMDDPDTTAEDAVACNALGEMDEELSLAEIVAALKAQRSEHGLPPLTKASE